MLHVEAFPTMFLIGPEGTVQSMELGYNPRLAETLPAVIERLLAGENLAKKATDDYARLLQDFNRRKADESVGVTQEIAISRAKIGPRSDPRNLKITQIWSAGVEHPGNLLVLPAEGGAEAKIAVLDGWRTVVEARYCRQDSSPPRPRLGIGHGRHAIANRRRWPRALATSRPSPRHSNNFTCSTASGSGCSAIPREPMPVCTTCNWPISTATGNWVERRLPGRRGCALRFVERRTDLARPRVRKRDEPGRSGSRLRRPSPLAVRNERPALGVLDYRGERLPDIPVPDRGIDIIQVADLPAPRRNWPA